MLDAPEQKCQGSKSIRDEKTEDRGESRTGWYSVVPMSYDRHDMASKLTLLYQVVFISTTTDMLW